MAFLMKVCLERTDVAAEMTAAAEAVTAASGVALIMAAPPPPDYDL